MGQLFSKKDNSEDARRKEEKREEARRKKFKRKEEEFLKRKHEEEKKLIIYGCIRWFENPEWNIDKVKHIEGVKIGTKKAMPPQEEEALHPLYEIQKPLSMTEEQLERYLKNLEYNSSVIEMK